MDDELELVTCPTGGCGLPAEVFNRLTSPIGDTVAVVCVVGHVYAGPVEVIELAA